MWHIFSWLYGFWNSIKQLLFKTNDPVTYKNINVDKDSYKLDRKTSNQTIFALNNIPEKIHEVLFKGYHDVSHSFFQMTFKKVDGEYEPSSSSLGGLPKEIQNADVRFIFIRVNLIKSSASIQHVNCIIIDKEKRFILYFEPMVVLRLDPTDITNILFGLSDELQNYKLLLPNDIGYNVRRTSSMYTAWCWRTGISNMPTSLICSTQLSPMKT